MNVYYLRDAKGALVHGVTFTTEKLAIAYGNDFTWVLPYTTLRGWCDPVTKETLMRIRVASLRVE